MKKVNLVNKVRDDCKKKIDTTMIGALSAIEEMFGHLWNHNGNCQTEEELAFKEIYDNLRSRILDNGNNQKRKIDEEFSKYDIYYPDNDYHTYKFIVKPRN